jgi:hypothetical protein
VETVLTRLDLSDFAKSRERGRLGASETAGVYLVPARLSRAMTRQRGATAQRPWVGLRLSQPPDGHT